jgi:hypothetical protein
LTTPTQAQIDKMPPPERGKALAEVQKVVSSDAGHTGTRGLVGRIALAALALVIISRRALLRVFLIPGLFIVPFVFYYPAPPTCIGSRSACFSPDSAPWRN